MNWNPDQIRAIEATGNVIVSAAAGAGKTSVLTERVFRLVANGTPIDRMLILTFTRAAAGEMKSRIFTRLESAAQSAATDRERAYLLSQAQLCAAANISTMHAFCAKVVFRHFFRVGLAPSSRTMDETESAVLRSEVQTRVLTELAETEPESYRRLIAAFNGERTLRETLDRLNRFLSAEPDPEAWLARAEATLTDRDAFLALLESEWASDKKALTLALSDLNDARDALPPACQKAISLLDELLTHARGALLQPDRTAYGAALCGIPTGGRLSFPKDYSAADSQPVKDAKALFLKLCKEQAERCSADADTLFRTQTDGAAVVTPLFRLLRAERSAYAEEKRQRACLDFDDLEHLTIEILRDERIAAEYRERFVYVIVDEYQDSNRVQEAILDRIRRKNNLFFVGDVKQSIYRFRKAEPKLFLEKCRTFFGDVGTRVDLKQNFRSGGAVIDAVNRVFETILHEPIAGIEYDAAARLYRGSSETGGAVECHVFEKKSDSDEESLADAEAEARFIADAIAARMKRPIFDSKTGKTRDPEYGDFAILLRSKTHAEIYAETLAFWGIPCYAQLSGGYFDAIEVRLVINLLRVLDNRRQDIPLLSVLRSPFFRFTDDELIALRTATRGSLLDCLLAAKEHPHVQETLKTLSEWRALAKRVTMEELLDSVMDAVQYRERMGALPGGIQRTRNLDALVERARAFDATGSGGIHGFLSFIDAAEAAADLGASQTVTANVVRIMTIHKSKGLEFPVVFLAGLGALYNRQDEKDSLLLHDRLGVGLQFLDAEGFRRRTYARRIIKDAIADAAWQEELRVLYVGMTRARSELILLGCLSNAEKALAELPMPTLTNLRRASNNLRLLLLSLNGYLPIQLHRKADVASGAEQRQLPALPEADPRLTQALCESLAWTYPFPIRQDLPIKTSVTALGERSLDPFAEPRFAAEPDGAALGSRVHTLLRRIPLTEGAEATLFTSADFSTLPISHRNALRWWIQSPLFLRMCKSPRAEREWSFVRQLPANALFDTEETVPVLLQGVIDACFLEDGAWVLLDYKTDRVEGDPAEHAERHRKQLTLYAEALAALSRIPVREAYIVFLNANAVVKLI